MIAVKAGAGQEWRFCPECGRAWVPGEVRCPFCATAVGEKQCPQCGRAWVPGETRCPFCSAAAPTVAVRLTSPVIGTGTAQAGQSVPAERPAAPLPPAADRAMPAGVRALAVGEGVAAVTGWLGAIALAVLSPGLTPRILYLFQSAAPGRPAPVGGGAVLGVLLLGCVLILLGGGLDLALAWGLWVGRPWARRLARVLAIPALTLFPLGTIAGAWILMYLQEPEVRQAFSGPGES